MKMHVSKAEIYCIKTLHKCLNNMKQFIMQVYNIKQSAAQMHENVTNLSFT